MLATNLGRSGARRAIAKKTLKKLQSRIGGVICGQKLIPLSDAFGEMIDPPLSAPLFRTWYALLLEPNREERSARMLTRLGWVCYWPTYVKQRRLAGPARARKARLCPVVHGMLFIPEDYVDAPRRAEIFDLAHVRGFVHSTGNRPARLTKADIEKIRRMEADLNLPPLVAKVIHFKPGQEVKFGNPYYAAFWGTGIVLGLASRGRISIEVKKLFGHPTKVTVPASELEAM
jgi:hypothetical protein